MAPTSTAVPLLLTLIILLISLSFTPLSSSSSSSSTTTTSREASKEEAAAPVPSPWPLQFHAQLFMNHSGALSMMDLWYDWIKGRNLNIIRDQLATIGPIYDLEWNNGTSFFYTLDDSRRCRRSQLDVGIPVPNWLDGAEYLGQQNIDGFLCNAWQKLNFIWYYEDVVTKQPVHWINSAGRAAHVMTFEVGAVFEDEKCQAPVYCFDKEERPEAIPSSVHFQQNLMLRSSLEDGMGLAM